MKSPKFTITSRRCFGCLSAFVCLLSLVHVAKAQPSLVSSVPADGDFGVSPTTSVVFTFASAVDTSTTIVTFSTFGPTGITPIATTGGWSAGNTIFTCKATAAAGFPALSYIMWQFTYGGVPGDSGGFMTSSGGGSTGSGTNAITSFVIQKINFYTNGPSGTPVLDDEAPYLFGAVTSLASNRTASSVTLKLPSGSVSNLTQTFGSPEDYYLVYSDTNATSFASTFPDGNYSFTVQALLSNQTVTVSLPAALQQPNAPTVINSTALAAVDPTKPFVLSWQPFQGGTASDFISVMIGDVFRTPDFGKPGALNGTATSVTIPAGTLPVDSTNTLSVDFYRGNFATNATYATAGYKVTTTQYEIVAKTSTPPASNVVLTNASVTAKGFTFDIQASAGPLTVEYNSTLVSTGWQTLLTTNSVGAPITITDPAPVTFPARFYRVRSGT